jgi:hypothetical protein
MPQAKRMGAGIDSFDRHGRRGGRRKGRSASPTAASKPIRRYSMEI